MKTIAIDFDGTIAQYKEYQGKCIFGEPICGAKESIAAMKKNGWYIIIHTTRSEEGAIKKYLIECGIPFDSINYNPKNKKLNCSQKKPLADIYIDDRAITFKGNWEETASQVETFSEWWRK